MKRLLKIGLIALIAFGLNSCDDFFDDDDGYSLGDFWVGFGVIHFNDENETNFTVEMDNGAVLIPVNHYHAWKLDNDDRVLINYTILGDKEITDDDEEYYVKVNSMSGFYIRVFWILPRQSKTVSGMIRFGWRMSGRPGIC